LFFVIVFIRLRIRQLEESEKIKHEKELKEKEELFKHQATIAEKEIIKLRNDKLSAEMIHRDKELANQTNSIIQKNKFLRKLNDELKLLQNSTDDASVRTKIAIIKKRISKETENRQQKVFETYFDQVHEAFFERLKEKFPQLSPKDLRLCAYVRMNISTKEIATLLNISDRGVEITRYRLRKKMEISREVNLSTYLSGI
jgi:DNA-binding CsgD family transcriptional regulator